MWDARLAPGWGTGSSSALVSARGPLTHGSHLAAHPVGVPEPATPQRARSVNPSHPPLGASPGVSALQPVSIVQHSFHFRKGMLDSKP